MEKKVLITILVLLICLLFSGCTSDMYIIKRGNTTINNNYNLINQTNNITTYINSTTFIYNSTLFTQLNDTPNTYVGESGKCVVVNPTETGLEFKDCATSSPNFTNASNNLILTYKCPENNCSSALILTPSLG